MCGAAYKIKNILYRYLYFSFNESFCNGFLRGKLSTLDFLATVIENFIAGKKVQLDAVLPPLQNGPAYIHKMVQKLVRSSHSSNIYNRLFTFNWDYNESDAHQKAGLIVDAVDMLGLSFPGNSFMQITESNVMKCFRQKLADKTPVENDSPAQKQMTSTDTYMAACWIELSKEILTAYCRDRSCLSDAVITLIDLKISSKSIQTTLTIPIPKFVVPIATVIKTAVQLLRDTLYYINGFCDGVKKQVEEVEGSTNNHLKISSKNIQTTLKVQIPKFVVQFATVTKTVVRFLTDTLTYIKKLCDRIKKKANEVEDSTNNQEHLKFSNQTKRDYAETARPSSKKPKKNYKRSRLLNAKKLTPPE